MAKSITDRITGPAIDAYQQLDGAQQKDVNNFLTDNPTRELYSREDLVNAWLTWNGIIGFGFAITSLVQNVYKGA